MSESPSGGPTPTPGPLPPEVVEELRRRRQAGSGGPDLAPAQPTPVGAGAPAAHATGHPWLKGLGGGAAAIALLLLKFKGSPLLLLTKLKLVLPFLLTILKTGGSMLLYVWFSAQRHGLSFAVGFVLCIFVHEMGHVLMLKRFGHPFSAPLFIPGMGAIIFQKQGPKSVWESAVVGIGGPVAGLLSGLVCHALFLAGAGELFAALAFTAYLLNLFNMTPIFPLDGGWITAAVSPRLWLVGVLIMGGLALTGFLQNPLIYLLILLSLPRLIHGLRTGSPALPGDDMHREPATPTQRIQMGTGYVALAAVLALLMGSLPR